MSNAFLLGRPWALLALIPVAFVIAWRFYADRRRPTLMVGTIGPLRFLPRTVYARTSWVPRTLGSIGLILATFALARPQARTATPRDVSVEGIDIVVAQDLSGSMEAADFKPHNRIYVAKEVLKEFVEARTADRIGLVVFASEAFTQCPLTLDHQILLNIIDQLKLHVIADGTAIGNGLATAVNRLRESTAKSRVVILITDGDSNAGNISPLEAAQMAKDLGIRVYTVLVGKGGKVPFPMVDKQGRHVTDRFGNEVYGEMEVDVNPDLLRQIANKDDGASYIATDRDSLRKSLHDILDSLEKSRLFDAGSVGREEELETWFLLPALALLLLDLLLRATRYRRFP